MVNPAAGPWAGPAQELNPKLLAVTKQAAYVRDAFSCPLQAEASCPSCLGRFLDLGSCFERRIGMDTDIDIDIDIDIDGKKLLG